MREDEGESSDPWCQRQQKDREAEVEDLLMIYSGKGHEELEHVEE